MPVAHSLGLSWALSIIALSSELIAPYDSFVRRQHRSSQTRGCPAIQSQAFVGPSSAFGMDYRTHGPVAELPSLCKELIFLSCS